MLPRTFSPVWRSSSSGVRRRLRARHRRHPGRGSGRHRRPRTRHRRGLGRRDIVGLHPACRAMMGACIGARRGWGATSIVTPEHPEIQRPTPDRACVPYTQFSPAPQSPPLRPDATKIPSPEHPECKVTCKSTEQQCSESAATNRSPHSPWSSSSARSASARSPRWTSTSPQSTRPSADAASPSSEPEKSTKSPSPPAAAPRSS